MAGRAGGWVGAGEIKIKANSAFKLSLSWGLALAEFGKKSTSGQFREHQNDITVGKQWQTDIAHMPRSKAGYKHILAERITNYICAFALKNITALIVSYALRIFLFIIPPFDQLC